MAKKMKPKAKIKTKKAAIKKAAPKIITAKIQGKLAGRVSHYFSDIKVCVIKVSAPLGVGDEVRIMGGENTDFNQAVKSMQIDHKEVKKAKKGDSVGLKVKEKVREGYKVYKV